MKQKNKRFKRIYIEITNVCNMNCKFCSKDERKKQSMTLEQIDKIFQKISCYTDYIYLHVKGEPLIHEDIGAILDLAKEYNLKVILTTNGTLLLQKVGAIRNKQALRQVNISVHSFEQNDIKNSSYLENIIEAVNMIVDSRLDTYISYRLWNLDDIHDVDKNKEALLKIGKSYGIKNILEIATKNSSIKLDENIFINLDTIFRWPSIENNIISYEGSCLGLIDQISILVDGTVVPCCLDSLGENNLGNIFKEDIETILEKEATKAIIDGFKNNKLICDLCRRCEFRINKRK